MKVHLRRFTVPADSEGRSALFEWPSDVVEVQFHLPSPRSYASFHWPHGWFVVIHREIADATLEESS